MKKILFVATVVKHFQAFYLPYFERLADEGWQVDCLCTGEAPLHGCHRLYNVHIERSPMSLKHIEAYRQIKSIIKQGGYDIIHCGTPMGGVLTRVAQIGSGNGGTKVIYTAHGFHFYKGSSLLSWLVFFSVERLLSRVTDGLITINKEDYSLASKHLKAGKTFFVHGVGYDGNRFKRISQQEKSRLRAQCGYSDSTLLLIYVSEINRNKNQTFLLRALAELIKQRKDVRHILVGEDFTEGKIKKRAEDLGVADFVEFYGHRNDVHNILPMCDMEVASSLREGLPVNVMESLACGLPVIATDNRGHRELVKDGGNGFLVHPESPEEMARKVAELADDKLKYERMSDKAVSSAVPYKVEAVIEEMMAVYAGY